MRYIGVTICGAMAGLGGAWLASTSGPTTRIRSPVAGSRASPHSIFGNWRPAGIAAGAGLFAFAQSLTQRLGTGPVRALFLLGALDRRRDRRVPVQPPAGAAGHRRAVLSAALVVHVLPQRHTVNNQLVFITPYLVTLLVLTFASQHLRPPAAEGRPWRKGDLE